jgi:hypothetical protein
MRARLRLPLIKKLGRFLLNKKVIHFYFSAIVLELDFSEAVPAFGDAKRSQ